MNNILPIMKSNKIITSKYTKYNFIPLNLYRQISKQNNIFFITTLILLSIPSISPFSPFTYLVALIIVIGISMIKDAIEDYNRHRQDKTINKKIILKSDMNVYDRDFKTSKSSVNYILINDKINDNFDFRETFFEDLKVGDYIKCFENQEIPTDLLFLYGYSNGKCQKYTFVETSNLDGENNLKKKYTHLNHECGDCFPKVANKIRNFRVHEGSEVLSDIRVTLEYDGKNIIENQNSIILRGSVLKGVEYIVGLVISTGPDTKIHKNVKKTKLKRSRCEKNFEKQLYWVFSFYIFIMILTGFLCSIFLRRNLTYLNLENYLPIISLRLIGTNYILYSYMVPLSLFVMIEPSRVILGEAIKEIGICRNSNVIEDLGTIDYVLTDKTGTLTTNLMYFECFDTKNGIQPIETITSKDKMFILALLICNSLQIFNGYEGTSQDEIAIVTKLKEIGYILSERLEDSLLINFKGTKIPVKIHKTLDFSSERQRMSIIVEINEKIYLFIKGSDQILKNKIKTDYNYLKSIRNNPIYRTLVVAYKELNEDDYNWVSVKNGFKGEGKELFKKFNDSDIILLEKNLEFLGITFVKDNLVNGTQETIKSLRNAKIKVWMVTGDKKETAMCVGNACGLENSKIISGMEMIEKIEEYNRNNTEDYNQNSNNQINMNESYIIYRTIPDHKAKIARFLKKNHSVLAVGDGNNDVSMIDIATVGVGIKGVEGSQATLAADFIIDTFPKLSKLILYYGRFGILRYSILTISSLYKNLFLIMFQFNYNFVNSFSGNPIFSFFFLNFYNILFTSFIPFFSSIFERDIPDEFIFKEENIKGENKGDIKEGDQNKDRRENNKDGIKKGDHNKDNIEDIRIDITIDDKDKRDNNKVDINEYDKDHIENNKDDAINDRNENIKYKVINDRYTKEYKKMRELLSTKSLLINLIYSGLKATILFWISYFVLVNNEFNMNGIIRGYRLVTNYFSSLVFIIIILTQLRGLRFYNVYILLSIFLTLFFYFLYVIFIQNFELKFINIFDIYCVPMFYILLISMVMLSFIMDLIFEIICKKLHVKCV